MCRIGVARRETHDDVLIRYNVATDSWRPISTVGAPSARAAPAAAWLGDKMVLFGSESYANDGFLYDPVTDQWTTMAIMGAPTSRARFAYAVSGDALFVWAGSYSNGTGAVWRPQDDPHRGSVRDVNVVVVTRARERAVAAPTRR